MSLRRFNAIAALLLVLTAAAVGWMVLFFSRSLGLDFVAGRSDAGRIAVPVLNGAHEAVGVRVARALMARDL